MLATVLILLAGLSGLLFGYIMASEPTEYNLRISDTEKIKDVVDKYLRDHEVVLKPKYKDYKY
jgi:hypothetical protein